MKLAMSKFATKEHYLEAKCEQQQQEIFRLRALLDDAAEDIASWGSYASRYFQEKHDLAGCVAKYKMTPNA